MARSSELLASPFMSIAIGPEASGSTSSGSINNGVEEKERLPKRPIRYVIFDLDETLVENKAKFINIFVKQMEADFGLKRGYSWIYATEEENRHKRSPQLVRDCLDYFGISAGEAQVRHAIGEVSRQRSMTTGHAFPQVEQMLVRLTRDGMTLGLSTMSDYDDGMFKLKYANLDHHFLHSVTESGERVYSVVGKDSGKNGTELKKGRAQFEALAQILGIKCDDLEAEGLFVSDSPEDFKEAGPRIRRAGVADDPVDRIALIRAGAHPVFYTHEYELIPDQIKYL